MIRGKGQGWGQNAHACPLPKYFLHAGPISNNPWYCHSMLHTLHRCTFTALILTNYGSF